MSQVITQEYEAAVSVSSLKPHPDNPRRGDVEMLTESIATNGFYGAVVAQRSTHYILVGNHRWKAARAEGLTHVPVFWLDVDDATARRIMAVDNRANDLAGYDEMALARLLDSMANVDGSLLGSGYVASDLDELLTRLGDGVLAGADAPFTLNEPARPAMPDRLGAPPRVGAGNAPDQGANAGSTDARFSGGAGAMSDQERPQFKNYDETVEDELPTQMCEHCSCLKLKPGAKASW